MVRRLKKERCHREEQARKKAVQALARNTQYNIRCHGHQKVAQQKTVHNSAAGCRSARLRRKVRDSRDNVLQPVEIHVTNDASTQHANTDAPSEICLRSDKSGDANDNHDALNPRDCPGVEVISGSGSWTCWRHLFAEAVRISSTNPAMIPTIRPTMYSQLVCSHRSNAEPMNQPIKVAAGKTIAS